MLEPTTPRQPLIDTIKGASPTTFDEGSVESGLVIPKE